jgi:putative photosynthetic complex assembly protein
VSEFVAYQSFPRLPLIGAGLLVAFTLVSVATTRLTGVGASHVSGAKAAIVRDLRFEDRPDGAVAVFDASNSDEVVVLSPGANGFIRGVLRSFARERRADADAITTATAGPPFRLSMSADHQLTIEDMATRRIVELNAFGETNSGAFAQLLNTKEGAP